MPRTRRPSRPDRPGGSAEGGVELRRVPPQPAPPRGVVRHARRQQRDEPWPVPEHPQMAQLVCRNRIERLRRGEDEPPAERQVALPGAAPPPARRVAQGDPRRHDAEGGPCRAIATSSAARARARNQASRMAAVGRRSLVTRSTTSSSPSSPPTRDTRDDRVPAAPRRRARGAAARGTGRAFPPPAPAARRAWPRCLLAFQMPPDPRLALGEEPLDDPLGTGPAAPAGGRDRDHHASVRLDRHPQPV